MKTPLYQKHLDRKARLAPFAGWEMPIQYESIVAEHLYTRQSASIFDICHMGEFEISGPSAEADLENLLTMPVAAIQPGQCKYGYLLQDNGGVLDDLTCYRLGSDRFFLVVNAGTRAGDAAWIQRHLSPETVFKDVSDDLGKLDIQGPKSQAAIEACLGQDLPKLKYFHAQETVLKGAECLISRTGYTGEWGYELYFPAEMAEFFWDLFLAGGEIKPAGLGARDTLRLEVGYPLYGHELSDQRTPVSVGRGMFIDMDKEFIGKAAVQRDLNQETGQWLVGLGLDGRRAARAGSRVFQGNREVGVVTSGSFAPSLGIAVALALVDKSAAEPGQVLHIDLQGKHLACKVEKIPFYKDGSARKKLGG